MSKIQENALLVKVQIKKWSNTKRDADLSDELATAKAQGQQDSDRLTSGQSPV